MLQLLVPSWLCFLFLALCLSSLLTNVRIPPYGKGLRQAAELRMTLSQRRWGPTKQVTGVTQVEDTALREQVKIEKQSVILCSDWCITYSLVKCYALFGVILYAACCNITYSLV